MAERPSESSTPRLGQLVLTRLKERVIDGEYRPGSRISIDDVRRDYGVSKQPVMEAMRSLQAVGLVDIVPQSGCRVSTYSATEVEDFYRLFARFEGEIAAAAAARRTSAQLAELDRAWDDIDGLHAEEDSAERARGYRHRNRLFHLAIHQMAHSRVMAELSERMWDLSDFFISTAGARRSIAGAVSQRNDDHDVIRMAIRTSNADVARAAMESHIVGTVALLQPREEDSGDVNDDVSA